MEPRLLLLRGIIGFFWTLLPLLLSAWTSSAPAEAFVVVAPPSSVSTKTAVKSIATQPQRHKQQQCQRSNAFTAKTTLLLSSTSSSKTEQPRQEGTRTQQQQKNLYQILGARGNESRAELKQLYVALAKESHPDALVLRKRRSSMNKKEHLGDDDGVEMLASTTSTSSPSFAEIAAAWRVLADPKQRQRYDRTLRAEAFSNEVVQWASTLSQQAAPVLEKFAIPLLRRTTATTLASVQAAVDDWTAASITTGTTTRTTDTTTSSDSQVNNTNNNNNNMRRPSPDLSRTFQAAMAAAKRAGQYVDSVEWMEQSASLEVRAKEKEQALQAILQDLHNKTTMRIKMALHTPKSGMLASEALLVLQEFNQTVRDNVSLWQQLLLAKQKTEDEIGALQRAEDAYEETKAEDLAVQADSKFHLSQQQKMQAQLEKAKAMEIEAMKRLEEARLGVANATRALDEATYTVQQAQQYVQKSSFDVQRTSQAVEMQSERVRKALWQKERDVLLKKGKSGKASMRDALDETERLERLAQLQELRRQEEIMRESSRILQANTDRLRARARKLQEKAQQHEKKATTTTTSTIENKAENEKLQENAQQHEKKATTTTTSTIENKAKNEATKIVRERESEAALEFAEE